MNTTDLFAAALNLPEPWSISKVEFKPDSSGTMELHIELSFPRGSKFACPECGTDITAYDTTPNAKNGVPSASIGAMGFASIALVDIPEDKPRLSC